jgi:6-phosphogluconate dehydrogenase (decarboxylating)
MNDEGIKMWKDILKEDSTKVIRFIVRFVKENKLEDFERFEEETYDGNTSEGKYVWADLDFPRHGRPETYIPPEIFTINVGFNRLMASENPDYEMKEKFVNAIRENFGGHFERQTHNVSGYYR